MIRPTAQLGFRFAPDLICDAFVADIKRCYLHIAPLTVAAVEREAANCPDGECPNVLTLKMGLRNEYWDARVEGADAMWSDVVVPWLKGKLYKTDAAVQRYNVTRAGSSGPVRYGTLEVVLGGRTVSIALPETSEFPADVTCLLSALREASNGGAIPTEVFAAQIPLPNAEGTRGACIISLPGGSSMELDLPCGMTAEGLDAAVDGREGAGGAD